MMDNEDFKFERTSTAFHAFRRAIEEGDTADFTSLVTTDFYFIVPIPFADWLGEQRGTKRFEELVALERASMKARMTPAIALEDGECGIVVFKSEGIFNGMPYDNELTIIFQFEGGKIRSFREYVGSTSHLLSIAASQ